jgi:uncharacterized RDD family membrane protein YckC
MSTNVTPENQDLFSDLEYVELEAATTGQRFGNYLIDMIIAVGMFYTLVLLVATMSGTVGRLAIVSPLLMLGAITSPIWYFTLMERFNNGRTIGKMITGTYVVRVDRQPLTFQDALLRTLVRLVPFERFSGLSSYPWHDTWTKTEVVKG